jgi:hypothetical protein
MMVLSPQSFDIDTGRYRVAVSCQIFIRDEKNIFGEAAESKITDDDVQIFEDSFLVNRQKLFGFSK